MSQKPVNMKRRPSYHIAAVAGDLDPCRNANGCHVLEYRQRLMETSSRWQSKREYVEFCQGSVVAYIHRAMVRPGGYCGVSKAKREPLNSGRWTMTDRW